MAAWLSALGARWDCLTCKRSADTLCARKGHTAEDAESLMAESKVPEIIPVVFRADAAGVCPRAFLTGLGRAVGEAYAWWEKGELGFDFTNVPMWLSEGMKIFAEETMKAIEFRRQET